MQSQAPTIIEHQFEIMGVLGQGSFGNVLMAKDQISGEVVALKMMRKDKTPLASFLLELDMSLVLSTHQNVIRTHPVYVQDPEHFVLCQELAIGGTLHSIIEDQFGIPEELMKRCARQLASALCYMHEKGIVHGDLKPDNVLLMDTDCHQIKLGDFGHSRYTGSQVGRMSHTMPYMSPELCCLQSNEHLNLTPSVDVWAFGVLLYVALTGYFPWVDAMHHDHRFNVFVEWQNRGFYSAPPDGWATFTAEAMGMFSQLLSLDPTSRLPLAHFPIHLDCPWNLREVFNDEAAQSEANAVLIEGQEYDILIIPGSDDVVIIENEGNMEYVVVEEAAATESGEIIYVISESGNPILEAETEITLAT